VALLAAGAKFRLDLGVDGALRVDESLQVSGSRAGFMASVCTWCRRVVKNRMRVQAAESR